MHLIVFLFEFTFVLKGIEMRKMIVSVSVTILIVTGAGMQWKHINHGFAATVEDLPGKTSVTLGEKSKWSLASLAANSAVAKEVGLSEKQRLELRKLLREMRRSLPWISVRASVGQELQNPEDVTLRIDSQNAKNAQLLDSILTPLQWERLKQVAFQIEVASLGFGEALTNGLLGAEVGIADSQKASIREKAKRIEDNLSIAIEKLFFDASGEMFRELTTEQQQRARTAVGSAFYVRDLDLKR
ncbi:MAG: hypothetical protein K9M08_10335 [Pirellula sp.]|nr:hypothetical protein [Pirellula sp.]